jgi:hypothetical protein
MATIVDANLPEGDVRAARVTFLLNGSPISSAKNLPVNLVDITDGTVGTATAVVQLNIGSADSQDYKITVVVSGAYYNSPSDPASQTLIVVSKPITGGRFEGRGSINNTNGYGSAGLIKGASQYETTFFFDVKYNNKGTNPQGKVTIWVWSYYKPDGTLDTTIHKYVIKSNSISTLAINQKVAGTALFSSKATVKEELPDGSMVSIDGGAILQISVTDKDSSGDLLAITVQRSKGGLWYSSNWNGTKTVEKAVSTGDVQFSVTPQP